MTGSVPKLAVAGAIGPVTIEVDVDDVIMEGAVTEDVDNEEEELLEDSLPEPCCCSGSSCMGAVNGSESALESPSATTGWEFC